MICAGIYWLCLLSLRFIQPVTTNPAVQSAQCEDPSELLYFGLCLFCVKKKGSNLLFAFLNDLVTNEHSNHNEIHRSASSLTEYHTVVTTPELVPEEATQKRSLEIGCENCNRISY